MAAPQSTQDQTTYEIPSIRRSTEQLPEYFKLISSVVAVVTFGTALIAFGILAVLVVSPVVASTVGTGGLLLVWAGGIAYVFAIPELARRWLVTTTHSQ